MKLATWKRSTRSGAREERLLRWLGTSAPDVLCLQELKVTGGRLPVAALRTLGYHAVIHGQKTYNGVAVLSAWCRRRWSAASATGVTTRRPASWRPGWGPSTW